MGRGQIENSPSYKQSRIENVRGGVTHKGNEQLQLQDSMPGEHVVKEGREQV